MAEIVDLFPKPTMHVEVTAHLTVADPAIIDPAPAISFRGREAIGICFSFAQVGRMFEDVAVRTVLCIAPPRCAYVSKLADALEFFREAEPPKTA